MSLIKVSNMFPPYRGCGWQRITHGGLVWVSGISSKDSNSEFSVDNVVSFLIVSLINSPCYINWRFVSVA